MKNKALVFLISIGLVVFAGLVFSVYRFASNNGKHFLYEGYISVTDTDSSDRVYFASGTSYKNGYNNEIVFKDSSDNKKEVSKYNFAFYKNKSISFLSDGVIMSLDDFETELVPYYNIKSNYIFNFAENGFVINGKNQNINLNNFIGRISDTKYLVVGDNLKLKLSSSDNLLEDYYFELSFVEGNQIKIVNENIDVKTISDESYIIVNDDVIIDLSNKVIKYKDEVKVNLTEITINSDNNIDILYDNSKDKEEHTGEGGEGNGQGNGQGNGNGTNNPDNTKEEYEPEKIVEYKNIPYVEVLSSSVGPSYISLKYKVNDKFDLISGPVTVKYMNLTTKEVYEQTCTDTTNDCLFSAQNLTSDNAYAVSILASYVRNGIVHKDFTMFQRTFKTSKLKVELVKDYASSGTLSYIVKMNELSGFDSAMVNLYDKDGKLVASKKIVNEGKDGLVAFEELKSNQPYTAKIENVQIGNVTYKSGYAALSSDKTLKYNPLKDSVIVNNPIAETNKKDYTFKFDLGTVNDKDHAIKEVKYYIYDVDSLEEVKTITKADAKAFTFDIDDSFVKGHHYKYNAVFAINDNEKTIYQKSLYSNEFGIDSLAMPYAIFNKGEVTANTLEGIFKIYDIDNAVDTEQKVYVKYVDSVGVEYPAVELAYDNCSSEESDTTKCVKLNLDSLTSDSTYTISLYGFVDIKDDEESENYVKPDFMNIGTIQVNTQEADIVYTDWSVNEIEIAELTTTVFSINLQMFLDAETSDNVKENLTNFDLVLYEGSDANAERLKSITVSENIVEDYFNNKKNITLATFGYTLEDLITRHMDSQTSLSKTYTIRLTNGKSGIDFVDFRPATFSFDIDERLLQIFDNTATADLSIIENIEDTEYYDETLDLHTAVGIKITPVFDNNSYVKKILYKVYDVTSDEALEPYEIVVDNINLTNYDLLPSEDIIFKDDETGFFKRGHSYQAEYIMKLDLNGDGTIDLDEFPLKTDLSGAEPVKSNVLDVPKQIPKMNIAPWVSDASSITYRYFFNDVDNVASDDMIYYSVGEETFKTTSVACEYSNNDSKYLYNYKDMKCFKIENLNDADEYIISLKGKLLDSQVSLLNTFEVSKHIFESILDSDNMKNKISFDVDDESFKNIIKIEVSDVDDNNKYLNRIASYSLYLYDNDRSHELYITNINDLRRYVKSSKNLITYKKSGENDKVATGSVAYVDYCNMLEQSGMCIYFDYSSLYTINTDFENAISDILEKDMTASVSYYYDSGLSGFLKPKTIDAKYALKIISDSEEYTAINDNYFITYENKFIYSKSALSGVYSYIVDSSSSCSSCGGFVADSGDEYEYENNGRSGVIRLPNMSIFTYSGGNVTPSYKNINFNYSITPSGIKMFINKSDYVEIPVIAKRLATVDNVVAGSFKISTIVPAITIVKAPNVNGIVSSFIVSGYSERFLNPTDKNVHLEIYSNEEEPRKVREYVIDKDKLNSQVDKLVDSNYKVHLDKILNYTVNNTTYNTDDYRYKISSVRVTSVRNPFNVEDYSYDYKTGEIDFSSHNANCETSNCRVEIGDKVDVYYEIDLYGLNPDTDYFIKAYLNMNSGKVYLIDSSSADNIDAKVEFKTLTVPTIDGTGLSSDVISTFEENEIIRKILIKYYSNADFQKFDNISYVLTDQDGNILLNNKSTECSSKNFFSDSNGTCMNRLNSSSSSLIITNLLDVTDGHVKVVDEDGNVINDDYTFMFNTKYNLTIYGSFKVEKVDGDEVNQTVELYNDLYNIRALEKPSLEHNSVVKRSYIDQSGIINLHFEIPFKDNDIVTTGFTDSNGVVENAQYLSFLSKNNINTVVLNTPSSVDYLDCNFDQDTLSYRCDFDYSNLDSNTGYYLVIRYKVDTHNKGDIPEIITETVPIYTPNNYGVATGKVSYYPSNSGNEGISELTFTYSNNMINRNDDTQMAYVTGIIYKVTKSGGGVIVKDYGYSVLFNNECPDNGYNCITSVDSDLSSDESYYSILLNHNPYPGGAIYEIDFNLILHVVRDADGNLITESTCPGGSANWNNGKCIITDSTPYSLEAQLKESK